ncbi:MAG: winged helix-turn-helix transcriptional regulator [Candidatus Magnetomorum sp.]|nr:winged helix-turn-helix transcriptional regulator [Candidatus Magnetomorum sp.]
MKNFLKVMKALSDPNRIKIAKMLQHKELCVCEIQAGLSLAQSTTSKHLKILEDAGIVQFKKQGLWINYSLSDGCENRYVSVILGNLRNWLNDDPDIHSLVDGLHRLDRNYLCSNKYQKEKL